MTQGVEMLPCPFCGSINVAPALQIEDAGYRGAVQCGNCWARGPRTYIGDWADVLCRSASDKPDSRDETGASSWNARRTHPAATGSVREALSEAIGALRPFADADEGDADDEDHLAVWPTFKVGDLRRAVTAVDRGAAALAAAPTTDAAASEAAVPAGGELRIAVGELEALANLIERPPLDDVLLERDAALRSARAIRVLLSASAFTSPTDWEREWGDRLDWDGNAQHAQTVYDDLDATPLEMRRDESAELFREALQRIQDEPDGALPIITTQRLRNIAGIALLRERLP